jgi:hypothetical protein
MSFSYGCYAWQIRNLPQLPQLVEICKAYSIKALCIKIADGVNRYNQVDQSGKWVGNDNYLKGTFIATLEAHGIEVHGWHYIYSLPSVSPKHQAQVSGERVKTLGIRSLKIDAEEASGGGWETSPYRKQSAATYMANLEPSGVPRTFPVGLCSYRYPESHSGVPWSQFLTNESMDHNSQQCYWAGAHNPGEQLLRSVQEYDEIRPTLLSEPVGAMYGVSTWAPTVADITEFMTVARDQLNFERVFFWSLDYVYAHNRWDWLETAAAEVTPAPTPPPPPNPLPQTWYMEVLADPYVNVREGPSTSYTDVGDLPLGTKVLVSDIAGVDAWARIEEGAFQGKWVCVKKSTRYLKVA